MVYLLAIALMILPFAKGLPQVEIGVVTFNIYMALILFAAGVSIFQSGTMIKKYHVVSTEFVMLMLGVSYLVSTLNATNLLDAGYLAFHALFIPFISFYVIKSVVVNERGFKIAYYGFIASILVFGFSELVLLLQTMQRPTAFGVPPISGATLLIVSTIFLLFYKAMNRSLKLPLLGLSLMALLSTLPRMYLLYLLVTGFVHKHIRNGRGLTMAILFIVATLLATFILVGLSELLRYYVPIESEGSKGLDRLINLDYWIHALQGRAYTYAEGLENFKDHILFGAGLYRGEINITRHNFHIEWLEYGGVVGYLLYAAVIISHYSRMAEAAAKDAYIAINLTILLGVLLNSVTNGFMHGLMPYVAFIIMGFSEARLTILKRVESIVKSGSGSLGNQAPRDKILRRKSKQVVRLKGDI